MGATFERGRDVGYDELGMLHENAEEAGLPFDGAPPVERVWVDVGGGRELSALDRGDAELVLLHGGAQNAHTWDTVCLALRPRRIVAVDLPGHGHSADARDPGESSSAVAAAEDVAVVLRHLAPEARAVVGMSFGGLTAIALAGLAPELVRSLALVDILPGLGTANASHIVAFVNEIGRAH